MNNLLLFPDLINNKSSNNIDSQREIEKRSNDETSRDVKTPSGSFITNKLSQRIDSLLEIAQRRGHDYITLARDIDTPNGTCSNGSNPIESNTFFSKNLGMTVNKDEVISILSEKGYDAQISFQFVGSYDADVKVLYLDLSQRKAIS